MTENGPGEHGWVQEEAGVPEETPGLPEAGPAGSVIEGLRQRARGFPSHQQELLDEALEQLSSALDEIGIAEDDLRTQNEELSAMQALLDTERRRYQELFEFAPDAYIVTDPEGNIEEANRAAGAMLGRRQRDLIGKPLMSYVDPFERAGFHAHLIRLGTEPRIQDWMLRLRTVSGASADVMVTVEAVRESDRRA